MASFFEKINEGLQNTRDKFQETLNVWMDAGVDVTEDFWEALEDAMIGADISAPATIEIVDSLRDEVKRRDITSVSDVFMLLSARIAEQFTFTDLNIFENEDCVVLFVGINGTGKTTTVGKIAKLATDKGRKVILGSADTFRAAAIEQLEVWADRAGVKIVSKERGSDPASVCYETVERAQDQGSELVLIDTAGRLHTSEDLMRELGKIVNVVKKRSQLPVYTVLVIDATTGQNGLLQAQEFNKELDLDGIIMTKLDGTAKGGIALAVSRELKLPIFKIGVGEGIDDLRDFDAFDYARAIVGKMN